jgi:surface antigen
MLNPNTVGPRILWLSLLVLAAPLLANPFHFLNQSPARHFDDRDNALMAGAVDAALADPAAGVTHEWRNEQSGSSGSATAGPVKPHDGRDCRALRLVNRARGQEASSTYDMCRIDGTWKVVSMPDR